jgi:Uma2 family endonuclease
MSALAQSILDTDTSAPAPLTWRDYLALPETGARQELIGGVLRAMAGAGALHQRVVLEFTLQLGTQLRGKPCQLFPAPFDVRLPRAGEAEGEEQTVVQPDLLIVCDPAKVGPRSLRGAPDFVLEVVSPGSIRHDLLRKRRLYEQAGVREYWVYEPEGVLLYRFAANEGGAWVAEIVAGSGVQALAALPELAVDFDSVPKPEGYTPLPTT